MAEMKMNMEYYINDRTLRKALRKMFNSFRAKEADGASIFSLLSGAGEGDDLRFFVDDGKIKIGENSVIGAGNEV